MWIRFTADYDFKATPGSTVAYRKGMECNVVQRCATLAVASGKAVQLRKTSKDEEPQPWQEPAVANSTQKLSSSEGATQPTSTETSP